MDAFIKNLIAEQKSLYATNYHQIVRDYNEEVGTVKGYNGRQLLELLQNCDDEGSEDVVINLNREEKTISIANNGTSFSEKGYRSLFIANLSPKSASRKYIGNKGLGFRSIINWSNAIEIQSNNISLLYSEQNRRANFEKLFDNTKTSQIRDEYGFNNTIYPMPFLSMPVVKEIVQKEFVTTIIIHYKEDYFQRIIEQVKNITAETLLFLRNVQQVKFNGFEDIQNIVCLKENRVVNNDTFEPQQQVIYEGSSWEIFEEDNELPEEFSDTDKKEKEHYQIKIAVEENLRQHTPFLYSFFPTNIRLNQPYILHATFDLDPTRNQIVNSEKNKYILSKVVDFTIKVAKYYTKEKVSYRPLQILNHEHLSDSLTNLGYYQLIQQAIATESIFPCINGTYKKIKEVIFISDEFADLLVEMGASDILGCHLLSMLAIQPEKVVPIKELYRTIKVFKDPLAIINGISALSLTTKLRATFICILINEFPFLKTEYSNRISCLINEEGSVINGSEYIYTPATQNEKLETPSFTKIQFIHPALYEELLTQLKYKPTENNVKSRFLYDKLNGYCNIHSYEPATLSQKIISETNNRIKENPETALSDIQEMNQCLFNNFLKLDDSTKNTLLRVNTPVITKGGNIKQTSDVVFSFNYPAGKKNEKIFEGVYDEDNYVGEPSDLGLKEFTPVQVQSYLLWIGVSRFAKYNRFITKTSLNDYCNYIIGQKNIGRFTAYEITYTEITNFENIIKKLTVNQLITWIHFDTKLKMLLSANNTDIFKYHYHSWSQPIGDKASYLKFQLIKKYGNTFSSFLIDERFPWVNNILIDYRADIFVTNEISKISINEILVLLGAKSDFNLLPIDKVGAILNKLPNQYPDGKRSQAFYKKALGHFKIHKQELTTPVKLFADDGHGLKLFNQEEIYFSDRIKLPNQLKSEFPLFNFPLRSGGNEAIKFFKINDLKEVKIGINSFENLDDLSIEFNNYLNKLKPLILTHRINVIEDEKQQKEQASICSKIEIIICSEIHYEAKEKHYKVAEYEFLQVLGFTYYIKINSFDTLEKLRKNSFFIESFADIISVSFDVSGEKNEFKYLLRNDYDDAVLSTKNDFGEDSIQEARNLLGLSDFKQAFWAAVFTAKGILFEEYYDDKALELLLKEQFEIDFKVNIIEYENLNNANELSKIEFLFTSINLSLKEFAAFYQYKISMQPLHSKALQNALLRRKNLIKSTVWNSLKDSGVEQKATYLNLINKYENFDDFVQKKSSEAQHQFSFDIQTIVEEYIKSVYGVLSTYATQNVDGIKEKNLSRFTHEEQYEIQQNSRFKSLIFFDDAIATIIEELKSEKVEEIKPMSGIQEPERNVKIINSDLLIRKQVKASAKANKVIFIPKDVSTRKLKEKGNLSEKVVFDYLNAHFKEVYWAAQDNEGLHYDMTYTNKNNIVKYVEVKTFDHGYFHLSKPEYDFGSLNKTDYEIWLVQNQEKVIPIVDFYTNDKYETVVNEYLVHLELKA